MKYRDVREDNCGIYTITNTINGKVYVGQSHNIKWRWAVHKTALRKNGQCNRHLQYAWNKYGEDSFAFEIAELCGVEQLDEREEYWINHHRSILHGYNIKPGGRSTRGWVLTKEQRKKISDALTGRKRSDEHSANISKAKKEYYKTHIPPTSIPVVCINTGEVFANSASAVKKYASAAATAIHDCCKGRRILSSGKMQSGEKLVWMYYSDYCKLTKSEIESKIKCAYVVRGADSRRRCALCITTGLKFDSCVDAAKFYSISVSNLNGCLKGRQHTAGKDSKTGSPLYWAYSD